MERNRLAFFAGKKVKRAQSYYTPFKQTLLLLPFSATLLSRILKNPIRYKLYNIYGYR